MNARAGVALAGLLALTAAFCSGPEKTAAPAADGKRATAQVKVSHKKNISFAPLYIGKEEGFFAEEGIDLELVALDANSALFAFTSGRLDVVTTPLRSGIFNAMGRGAKIRIVGDRGHADPRACSAEAFVAPAAVADRIAARGLKGEKISLVRGGSMEYLVDRLLERHGAKRSDVEFVQTPPAEGSASAVRRYDAITFLQEPQLSASLAGGKARVISTIDEIAPRHQIALIAFGPRLIGDPDLGRRFMRAYIRGVRQFRQGKTDRNVEIISRYAEVPPATIRAACWQTISADASIDPEGLAPFFAWAHERGYLEPDMPPAGWWDRSFIDAALRGLDR